MSEARTPDEQDDPHETVVLTVESADDAQLIRKFLAEVPWLEVRCGADKNAA